MLNQNSNAFTQLFERGIDMIAPGLDERFIDDDPIRWIYDNYRIPETPDHIMFLGKYQEEALRHVLTRRPDGTFPYSIIVWGDLKKSIKSSVAAAVALWRAFNTPWGSIKIVANDFKQADSRVAYYIRRCIELNPLMGEGLKIRPSGYWIKLPNQCRIEAVPVDPKGEAGGNDDMIVFSELWGANNVASKRMWTEMTLSPMKQGKSFRWVETYAGFSGESELLESLWASGTRDGRLLDWADTFDPPLEVYENPEFRMFCMWNTHPRLPWQTQEYYAQEAAVLTPSEFRRVHRNEFVSSESTFIPIEWWDSCLDENLPPFPADESTVFALDGSVSGDSSALVGVGGGIDGEHFRIVYARQWKPSQKGHRIDFFDIEAELNRIIETYNVVEFCYDPYQLEYFSDKLRKEMTVHVHAFNQGNLRLLADKTLFDMIRDRKLLHDGTHHDLRDHLNNANAKINSEDSTLRLVKRNEILKIDLAVSLSMALWRARHWRL